MELHIVPLSPVSLTLSFMSAVSRQPSSMSTPLIDDTIPCIFGISSIFEPGNVQLRFVEMAMAPAVIDLLGLRHLSLLP